MVAFVQCAEKCAEKTTQFCLGLPSVNAVAHLNMKNARKGDSKLLHDNNTGHIRTSSYYVIHALDVG